MRAFRTVTSKGPLLTGIPMGARVGVRVGAGLGVVVGTCVGLLVGIGVFVGSTAVGSGAATLEQASMAASKPIKAAALESIRFLFTGKPRKVGHN